MRAERRWFAAGLAVTAGLALADVATGRTVNFTAIYFMGALVAAAHCSTRRTAVVAALAVGLTFGASLAHELGTSTVAVRTILAAVGGAICVLFADQRAGREARLASIERVAEVAQRALLSTVPDEIGGVAFAARYVSAAENARIGGDLYEVIPVPDGCVRVLVGDVCGHGLPAVRVAAATLSAFREAALVCERLEDAAALLDRRLAPQLVGDEFITAVLAEFRPDGFLDLVNCGHPSPLIVRPGGRHERADGVSTTPLGIDPVPAAARLRLEPGDRILFYTDGLVEGRTAHGRGIVVDSFAPLLTGGTLEEALERVLTSLHGLVTGSLDDDLALVLAEVAR